MEHALPEHLVHLEVQILRRIATACALTETLQVVADALSHELQGAPVLMVQCNDTGVIVPQASTGFVPGQLEVVSAFAETSNLQLERYVESQSILADDDDDDEDIWAYYPFPHVSREQLCFVQPVFLGDSPCAIILVYFDGMADSDANALIQSFSELVKMAVQADNTAQQLTEARDDALKVSQLKSEFLANMSHEIRTPMNGVLGMLALVKETPLDEEQLQHITVAQQSGENLLEIINDILDFSKIEAGKLNIEQVAFDFRQSVQNVVSLFMPKADEQEIDLVCLIGDDVPADLIGDPTRIGQVLTNLIGNAIKFTEEGEVVVSIGVTQQDDNQIILRCEVSDTGVGIAPDAQKQIFDAFGQQDGSTTRKFGGTGLGLTISKQLVERMSGKIGLISEVERGSLFWFTLQLAKVYTELPAPENSVGKTLLIVDEADDTQKPILESLLVSWNISYQWVVTAEEADTVLQKKPGRFDAVLIGTQLADSDGIDLATNIREELSEDQVKLVLLTALGVRLDDALVQSIGIQSHLKQPIQPHALRHCLQQLFQPKELEPPKAVVVLPSAEKVVEQNDSDIATRILVVEDNRINQKVALGLLKKAGLTADVANNGKEALDAMSEKRYDLIFMDCQMPVMDGYEATGAIRASEASSDVRNLIIAMTANAMDGDESKCLAAGMDDYLSKPVKLDKLRAVIEKWLPHALSQEKAE
ncbi:MAG: response regulator [Methylococcales bacterium]|nr:response regulator [Methylococcales bacterium]MBT7442652.1 response regulator [Methylococcales bacterium]